MMNYLGKRQFNLGKLTDILKWDKQRDINLTMSVRFLWLMGQARNVYFWRLKMSWKQLVKLQCVPFYISHDRLASSPYKRRLMSGNLLLANVIGVVYQSTFD
ncbi:hypothetical protein C9I99_06155 [Photobacterium lutimaris]|uniref:Uncharacterized protein n=1 Tax=Photobacterium lutimaris TaxID=388278 RepID=A0A2T3J0V2_9GAMM|nr:hypothetical protein C9I99_06155 [Photobacterium lutimaris]